MVGGAEVIARVARGDSSALAALYDGFGAAVYSLACRIVGNPSDAEDVTQESSPRRGARRNTTIPRARLRPAVTRTDPNVPAPVALAVTLEPEGGVPSPTGPKYLVGAP